MRRVTRSATTPSTSSKPIRQGQHVIDHALAVAEAIHAGAPTTREQRASRQALRARYGSKGRISVLEHLGLVLRDLSPFEIEVYRSPRVTWKLVQRVVRKGVDRTTVIRAFRDVIAVPPVDRRRQRRQQTSAITATDTFDPKTAEHDPVAYLAATLAAWDRGIGQPLRTMINQHAAREAQASGIRDVGQSLSMLMASINTRRGPPVRQSSVLRPDHTLVLRMLKRIEEIQHTLAQTVRLTDAEPKNPAQ